MKQHVLDTPTYIVEGPQHAGVVAEGSVHNVDQAQDSVTVHKQLVARLSGLGCRERALLVSWWWVVVMVVKVWMVAVMK